MRQVAADSPSDSSGEEAVPTCRVRPEAVFFALFKTRAFMGIAKETLVGGWTLKTRINLGYLWRSAFTTRV